MGEVGIASSSWALARSLARSTALYRRCRQGTLVVGHAHSCHRMQYGQVQGFRACPPMSVLYHSQSSVRRFSIASLYG